jgi:hypothetical protein
MSAVSDHLAEIRKHKKRLRAAVTRFTKEHHDDCECWFALEWGMLLVAFDDDERTDTLDKLEHKYAELGK